MGAKRRRTRAEIEADEALKGQPLDPNPAMQAEIDRLTASLAAAETRAHAL